VREQLVRREQELIEGNRVIKEKEEAIKEQRGKKKALQRELQELIA